MEKICKLQMGRGAWFDRNVVSIFNAQQSFLPFFQLETIETALPANFTSGEGWDLSPFDFVLKLKQIMLVPSRTLGTGKMWSFHSKLETIETALPANFTSGEGWVFPEPVEGWSLSLSKGISHIFLF